jgi:hypothetical protein
MPVEQRGADGAHGQADHGAGLITGAADQRAGRDRQQEVTAEEGHVDHHRLYVGQVVDRLQVRDQDVVQRRQ